MRSEAVDQFTFCEASIDRQRGVTSTMTRWVEPEFIGIEHEFNMRVAIR